MTPASLPTSTKAIASQFTGVVIALALVGTAFVFKTVGTWFFLGQSTATWTSDRNPIEVALGDSRFHVPANMIRHSAQRIGGRRVDRLDLAVAWPDMKGFEEALSADFLDSGDRSPLLLITLEEDANSRDTRERLETIYLTLAKGKPVPGPGGLSLLTLSDGKSSGVDFVAYESERTDGYAARCFTPSNVQLAAICQRDIRLNDKIVATYRFRQAYLANWGLLDRKVGNLIRSLQPEP